MNQDDSTSEVFFEAVTPLGFTVRVTRRYWEIITTLKHPVMAGCEALVQAALSDPDEIRLSRSDASVYLFYRQERTRRRVCAVAKRLDGTGFLITAYPADAIKEGDKVWQK